MLNPTHTITQLIIELTDAPSGAQEDYQAALVNNGPAITLLHRFSQKMMQEAIEQAARRGEHPGTALIVAAESSTVAVMLLGIEYGRAVERDAARSLEELLSTEFPEEES